MLAGQAVTGTLFVTTYRLVFLSNQWMIRKRRQLEQDAISSSSSEDLDAPAAASATDSIVSDNAAALIADWEGKVVRARWILDGTVVPDAAHCIVIPLNSLSVVETGQEPSPSGGREPVPVIRLRRAQFHPVSFFIPIDRGTRGAGGGEEGREKGKKTILYGLIGMVVLFGVWGLVNILLSILVGATGSGAFPSQTNTLPPGTTQIPGGPPVQTTY